MIFPSLVSLLLTFFLSVVAYEASLGHKDRWLTYQLAALAISAWTWWRLSSRERKIRALKNMPFPPEWEDILNENVAFYRALDDEQKKRFQQHLKRFIATKRITGIKTDIDDTDRLLVASSAIIPIFGFDNWSYPNLSEVLLYPGAFRQDFGVQGKDRNVLGMVGNGIMNGTMILSRPSLRAGFDNNNDSHNVGIHEFAHLLDATDGSTDGLPQALVDKQFTIPWLDMIYQEMGQIKKKKSDINPYGGVSREEFFAVASEYFFERPGRLQELHPELYKLLSRVYNQDNRNLFRKALDSIKPSRKKGVSRNAPCPCGSGRAFKKCCGKTHK